MNPGPDSRTPSIDLPTSHSHGPSRLGFVSRTAKTLVVLALIAVGVWAAWRYGRPLFWKFKLSPEVESAAVVFAHQLPEKASGQAELQTVVTSIANDKLKTHLAKNARWHVAFGQRGDALTVVRDDLFTPGERAFVARVVEAARVKADPSDKDFEVVEFPLGAVVERVDIGDDPWYVAAVWCE